MAFKDSGDDDGKKTKKSKNSKGSRNGRGSLVLVLVVLWLIGLTAAVAFFNLPKGPGSSDLEDRVSTLEQRAGQVRGTITPPGTDDLGTLTDRMNELEQRLSGGATTASASGAAGDSGAMAGDCPCDRILSRLDQLENQPATAGAGTGSGAASASAGNRDVEPRPAAASASSGDASGDESAEAPRARSASASPKVTRKSVRAGTRKPRPPRDIPGVEVRSFGRTGRPLAPVVSSRTVDRPAAAMGGTARNEPRSMPAPNLSSTQPVYSRDGNLNENLQQSTHSESVYDITRRMAPMYGYTESEMRGVERLAPGAAIYPGSNGGYVGSLLAN